MKVSKSISLLYKFLQKKEKACSKFSSKEILEATGWKGSTFKTYFIKGQLSDFITKISEDLYEASNIQKITEIEFAKLLSQSKHRRGLGHNCRSKLSKALLRKSRDNMLLALELYNRPSLANKSGVFVMCFCASWEQLLKAILIEKKGEDSVFKKKSRRGIKETISLRDCLEKIYSEKDNVRRNIERVTFLRDQAVHLLMPEIQGITSRIFQSGIMNYSAKFEEFTEVPFLSRSHAGLISLAGDFRSPPIATLRSAYGDIADDISDLSKSLRDEVEKSNNIEFAIPLNVKLVFATDQKSGDVATIVRADDGMEGLKRALIIEKPVDRSRSHPYRRKNAVDKINRRIREKYTEDKISKHLVSKDKNTGKYVVNFNCFDSVVYKNKWKNSNNEFHYKNTNPEYHYYSERAIEVFIQKVMENESYLKNAKDSYNRRKPKP